MAMDDRWMTVKDVAEYLQLSTDQIYRLAQQGKIPASKVGARWRFKRGKIDEWGKNQSVAHKTQLSVGEGGRA
jgi:excisionase family DNA binding protein